MKDFEQERFNMRVPKKLNEAIKAYAIKNGISHSQAGRELIEKALLIEKTSDDIDLICSLIRAEIQGYFDPQVNRLVKLIVKSGITSAAGYFLNAKALAELVPQELQIEFEQALRESKKQGVVYIQVNDKKITDVIDEMTNN